MDETYSRPLVIGVDAGGTRSRACLTPAVPDAPVLGRGVGGPGNALTVGRADLTRHLTQAVAGALTQAAAGGEGTPEAVRGRVVAAFGGFAGAAEGLGSERGQGLALSCLRAALAANGISGAACGAGGDTEAALAAAPGAPDDGLVLIAGTGAIATRLTAGGRSAVVDGHGWLLGDEGSGFWLGGHGVRAALEALDGRGPWTSLVGRVAARYLGAGADAGVGAGAPGDAGDAWDLTAERGPERGSVARWRLGEAIVAAAYGEPPARLATLSTEVVAAADADGDPVAAGLLRQAARLLARSVRALDPAPGEPLVLTGGLLGPHGPLLPHVTALLGGLGLALHPVLDGSAGAAALAARLPRP